MAIDTARKRASVLYVVLPSGTIDQFARQTINKVYGGILADLPSPAEIVGFFTDVFTDIFKDIFD